MALSLENEVWYQFPNYEFYEYSNLLRIRSKKRHIELSTGQKYTMPSKIMSITLPKNGYAYVSLSENGKKKTLKVHRFFGLMFIPNPENKEQLNHKNGNKHDYSLENLEWVSRSENSLHAIKNGFIKIKSGAANHLFGRRGKYAPGYGRITHNSKLVLDTQMGIFYDSVAQAAKAKNISQMWLGKQLKNSSKYNNSLMYV